MKTDVRLSLMRGADGKEYWVASETEAQGKDAYVRVLGMYDTLDEAQRDFPAGEVYRDGVKV